MSTLRPVRRLSFVALLLSAGPVTRFRIPWCNVAQDYFVRLLHHIITGRKYRCGRNTKLVLCLCTVYYVKIDACIDELLPGGRSMVDYARPPVLWRRGNSFQNGTTLSSTLEVTSETKFDSSTPSSTSSSSSESVLPTTDWVFVTSSRGSEDGLHTTTNDANQIPQRSSDLFSSAATTSANFSGVESATYTNSPTITTVWDSQDSQQAPRDHFTSNTPPSLGETSSSASPSPLYTSKEDLELLSTSEVGGSSRPVMSSGPALTTGISVVPTPNEIPEDSIMATISVAADSQLVSPTPSYEAQPITTPLERPTFATTTNDYQGATIAQLNTVAYQSTLLSSAIQVVPQPTSVEYLISATAISISVQPPIIEYESHSTVATSDNRTVIDSSYSGLHTLPTTSSVTWIDQQSLVTGGPTIIPTGASTSFNVSEIETVLQKSNTTGITVPTNTTRAENTKSSASEMKPTMTIQYNITSMVLSHHLSKTSGSPFGWTNSSSERNHGFTRTFVGSALPSGFINSNHTQNGGNRTTLISSLRNATFGNFLYPNTTSATATIGANSTIPTNNPNSTTPLDEPNYGATRTLWTRPTITSTATETIVVSAPPPLNTPQTAGVAIGSVAGVLLAVVAAVFLARRYYTQGVAKRRSTGSVYPKMAYLYDPLSKGDWDGSSDYHSTAMMSGGANGFPTTNSTTTTFQHASVVSLAPPSMPRFSDPGNPFSTAGVDTQERVDPTRNSLPTPVDTVTAFSAAVGGYALATQASPTYSGYSPSHSYHKISMPSPTLSPLLRNQNMRHYHSRSVSQSSVSSVQTEVTINGSMSYNTSYKETPLSPYRNHLNLSLASVKEIPNTDPFAEPLEDDLYLPIDSMSETPHSILVYAPPPTPRTPNKHNAPAPSAIQSSSSTSIVNSVLPRCRSYERDSIMSKASFASRSTISLPELSIASYGSESWTERTESRVPSHNHSQHDLPISPISSSPAPVHRGWEDIKRFSNESSVPSPLFTPPPPSFSPPPPTVSPVPSKKRSLIQLRRREPALAGTGHVMMSSAGHPLTVKIPSKFDPSSGFEGPRMSLLAKLNMMGDEERDDHIRSPGLSITESLYSSDGLIHQKRSEQYAKPGMNAKVVQIGH